MKFVDSLVRKKLLYTTHKNAQTNFVEARITVSNQEYYHIEQIFNFILSNNGQLNAKQQEDFQLIQKVLNRFRKDWRYKQIESDAKTALLKAALSLNPSRFEDLFIHLQYFLRRSNLQAIFEQVYIALKYSKAISKPQNLDFVTRIYLERMSIIFELLKPNLTKKQIQKWEENVARKLKRF